MVSLDFQRGLIFLRKQAYWPTFIITAPVIAHSENEFISTANDVCANALAGYFCSHIPKYKRILLFTFKIRDDLVLKIHVLSSMNMMYISIVCLI